MYHLVGMLATFTLICSACTKPATPGPIPQAAFFRVTEYQAWTCAQLLDEADLLIDALAVAAEHRPDTKANERIAYLTQAKETVRQQLAAKNCGS
jgi:dsDNA-binding SOS-regulon protein